MRVVRLGALFTALLIGGTVVVTTPPERVEAVSPWFVLIELDSNSPPVVVDNRRAFAPGELPLHVVAGGTAFDTTLRDLRDRPYVGMKLIFGDPALFEDATAPRTGPSPPWLGPDPTDGDLGVLTRLARFYPARDADEPPLFLVWHLGDSQTYRVHVPTASDLAALEEVGVPLTASELAALDEAGVPLDASELNASGEAGGVRAAEWAFLGGLLALLGLSGLAWRVRRL